MHILKNFITIEDLQKRWGCDKDLIEPFTYEGMRGTALPKWYGKETRVRPDGGLSIFVKPAEYLNGCVFDMADVLAIEELNPELLQAVILQVGSEPKSVNGKFVFSMHQLIKKEDLYKRWFGATHEEIAMRFDGSELRAYGHYKGPINDIIWCKPGYIYFHDNQDLSNPGLYEFIDEQCDYFLLEDVERCEAKYPEYVGNITKESLGLVQNELSNMQGEKPEYIHANDLRKEFGMSPVQFVDYLRGNLDLPLCGSHLLECDRLWFYKGASLEQAAEMLDDLLIHRLDIEHHCAMPTVNEGMSTVESPQDKHRMNNEAQLAEAQEKIESLRMWNKRLNEQNQKLRAEVTEKAGQITALENVNTEMGTTTRTKAATEARQTKVLDNWQHAFKIMVSVILQCHGDGPKNLTRAELKSMCSRHGGKLTGTQRDFLRECLKECLGDEHVNTDGGPSPQR